MCYYSLDLLDTHKFLSCAAVIQLGDNILAVRKLSIISSQVIHKRGLPCQSIDGSRVLGIL